MTNFSQLKQLKIKNKNYRLQLKKLEMELKDIEGQISKITHSKPFYIWRAMNITKEVTKFIFNQLIGFLTAVLYVVVIAGFFLVTQVMFRLSQLFAKPFKLSSAQIKLNGVSFIIPTWNKSQMVVTCVRLLDQCLNREAGQLPTEIIVVENGSTDDSVVALRRLKTKTKLTVIASPVNLGFAKGINLGVSKAKYNYVYVLNNDMETPAGMLKNILKQAKSLIERDKPFFGLATQIFFFDPTKRREESGKTYASFTFGFITVAHFVSEMVLKKPSLTLYPGGGSSLLNKHAFSAIGGYDHAAFTPLYCEDLDAGLVAWKLGLPSFFEPSSTIIHHHRSSTKNLSQNPNYFMYKNWLVLLLKNLDHPWLIVQHLVFYPLRIIADRQHCRYAVDALKHIVPIFLAKVSLFRFKQRYSEKELLNFVSFETHHDISN
jgi:GT2 family glycosyltransferase